MDGHPNGLNTELVRSWQLGQTNEGTLRVAERSATLSVVGATMTVMRRMAYRWIFDGHPFAIARREEQYEPDRRRRQDDVACGARDGKDFRNPHMESLESHATCLRSP